MPRSMARSRATGQCRSLVAVRAAVAGRQGVHLAVEAPPRRSRRSEASGNGPRARRCPPRRPARRRGGKGGSSRSRVSGQRSGARSESVLGVEAPALASGPGLALPDGHGGLQGVDARSGPPRRPRPGGANRRPRRPTPHRWRRAPVRCRMARRPRSGQRRAGGVGDGPEPGLDLALVGLVLEALRRRSALGVVAGRAGEGHHGATRRQDGPVGHEADGQRLLGQPHPGEVVGRSEHGPPAYGCHRPRSRDGRAVLRWAAVPEDEGTPT